MIYRNAKNGNGVSAVVGIILLVAITVVLGAVIAAYALKASDIPASKIVSVHVERVSPGSGPGTGIISVENTGGINAHYLRQGAPGTACFKVFVDGVEANTVRYPANAADITYAGPVVGSKQYFQVDPRASIIIVACYEDSTESEVWSGTAP